jgi:MtrB/PioB family decaheme-associated outer membrane protein
MKTGAKTVTVTAMIVSGLLPLASAMGEEPDTSQWHCNFCTYATGWFGDVQAGTGWLSDASRKFADYRGLEDEGLFLSLYGDLHYRDAQDVYLDLYSTDLGTGSRKFELQAGKRGKYAFHLNYREIPKHRGFGTQSPFIAADPGTLKLPANWVAASTAGGMSALGPALSDAPLQTRRRQLDAGFAFNRGGNWRYEIAVQHSEKEGDRPFGAGVLTVHSSQFAAPVDFVSDRISLNMSWSGSRSQLRLGLVSSYFDNQVTAVRWDNPFSPVGNTRILQAALEPDSDFRQFHVKGLFRLGSSTRLSGSASIGEISQHGKLLPYSINPDFDDLPLPGAVADRKFQTDSLKLTGRVSSRLSNKLDLNAQVRVDDRDNRSPVALFTPVITDLVQRPETPNRPYSFNRRLYSTQLSYRAQAGIRVLGGVRRRDIERTNQSVRRSEETTWWGEVNFDHWESAQLRLRLERSSRDLSPYLAVNDTGLLENPLVRKFNLAGRERERGVIELDLSPTAHLSAGLSAYFSRDDYNDSTLGLLEGRERSYNFDLAYSPTREFSIYLFVSRDGFDSLVSGALFSGNPPWTSHTKDRFTTAGAGLSGQLNERLNITIDYLSADSSGRIQTDSGAGEAPFPNLQTDLSNLRIHLVYRLNEHWSWLLDAEHERYDSRDWQFDGLGPASISSILGLGTRSPDYSISALRLMARYRF